MSKSAESIKKIHAALMSRVERENLSDIARGADVPYGWLQQFFYRNVADPAFTRVAKLAKYLGLDMSELI